MRFRRHLNPDTAGGGSRAAKLENNRKAGQAKHAAPHLRQTSPPKTRSDPADELKAGIGEYCSAFAHGAAARGQKARFGRVINGVPAGVARQRVM